MARRRSEAGEAATPVLSMDELTPSPDLLREVFKRELLDQGPPLYIADLDGRIVWANAGFHRLAAAAAPVAGAGAAGFLPIAEIAAEVADLDSTVFREDAVRFGKKTQRLRSRHVALHDEAGGVAGIAGIIQGVNDEAQQQETIALLRERLDDIARLASDWIWETDADLVITSVSHRVTAVLGYHPRELIGRSLLSLVASETNRPTLEAHFAQKSPFRDLSFEAIGKSGASRLFLLSAVPVFSDTTGGLVGFRGTASDVTELRRRELGLREAKEMAETASRAKTEFLANMSHELRTPLNAIIGFAEIMQMELLGPMGSEQYRGYAADIHDSARHLLGLINDILDVSKIEAGKADLNEQDVDVVRLIDSVVRLIGERAQRAEVALSSRIEGEIPPFYGDDRKLKQILLNLLSNAVKFTPGGGRVELSARIDETGDLLLAVADTGIGIAPGDLERVMQPFAQVDSRLNRRYEGTGLGLPLTRGLVELHGGTMTIESELDRGTTVTVRLPAERLRRS